MAHETVVEQNPGAGNAPGAVGDTTQVSSQNTGTRADTNRVATDQNTNTQNDQTVKEKTYSFKEDRSDWIPRTRLNDESGKRTKLEQELAVIKSQLDDRDKKLKAALGIEVPSADEQELQEVREALYKVNPKLKLLDQLDEQQLERILGAAESAESTTKAQWARHREEMLGSLTDIASDLLNVDKPSDAQVKRLHRAFREEAREQAALRAKAEQSQDPTYDFENDFVARYERGDEKLLKEFAKSFLDEWGIPARRAVTTSVIQRQNRPVPRGERQRSHLTQGPPKIDYNDDNAFKEAMKVARNGGGDV